MITFDMVKAGYEAGLIKLIEGSAVFGDGIVCAIGDNWFYFGGQTAEDYTDVEKYKNDIPASDIIKSIFEVLVEFSTEFEDEYLYYEYYLRERMPEFKSSELEFVFDEEIMISEDKTKLEGYLWAMNSLVERLKAQEQPLSENQAMDNINFYPVYDVENNTITIEGHYYLVDDVNEVGKAFTLNITLDEADRLVKAFEAYCQKREGKSCFELLNSIRDCDEKTPLSDQILSAEKQGPEKKALESIKEINSINRDIVRG